MMSWMPSMRNANRVQYMYTAGVFAAVCVVADLLVSCLSQLSDAQVQNTLFAVALSVSAFVAGSVNAGRKNTHAKAAPAKKLAVPAKKSVQTKGAAREGDHEARQAAKRLVQARGAAPVAPPAQADPPAEPQPAEPQPAEPAVEGGASHAAQNAEPQPEPPQRLPRAPRYASRGSADARVPTEGEDTTSKSPEEETVQPEIDARVIEQPRQEGVEHGMVGMLACVRNNDADAALKLFDQHLKKGTNCDCEPTAMPEDTRSSFFTLVAGQLDDARLKKDGLQILAAVRAHGVQPPHVLQNRLICAWGGNPPEQVLDYLVRMREEGVALSSAACRCIMADVVGSTGGKSRPSPVDAATRQDDPARDGAEEEPDVVPHAATERTRLRVEASTFVPTEAPTFVPTCWEGPWQMRPEVSMVCSWVPRPPGLCDEFPQAAAQQMGGHRDECTTVILRNLPCPFLRDNLIAAMDAKGFAGLYNFVYVPADFKTGMGLGYAFVNLVTEEEVQRFALAFNGFRDWPRASAKICTVDMSRTQGLTANVERYRNSPVMGAEVPERFRPVLFSGTERVPFPEPTRELPRVFHKSSEW